MRCWITVLAPPVAMPSGTGRFNLARAQRHIVPTLATDLGRTPANRKNAA